MRFLLETVATLVLVSLLLGQSAPRPQRPAPGHVYPEDNMLVFTRNDDDGIYVNATINGTKGLFQIDTGASNTSVTASFAKRAHLATKDLPTEKVQTWSDQTTEHYLTDATIDMEGAVAKNAKVSIRDKERPDDEESDGLLGLDFLSRFKITITDKEMTVDELDPPTGE